MSSRLVGVLFLLALVWIVLQSPVWVPVAVGAVR